MRIWKQVLDDGPLNAHCAVVPSGGRCLVGNAKCFADAPHTQTASGIITPEATFQSPAQDVVKEMLQTSASAVEVQQREQ